MSTVARADRTSILIGTAGLAKLIEGHPEIEVALQAQAVEKVAEQIKIKFTKEVVVKAAKDAADRALVLHLGDTSGYYGKINAETKKKVEDLCNASVKAALVVEKEQLAKLAKEMVEASGIAQIFDIAMVAYKKQMVEQLNKLINDMANQAVTDRVNKLMKAVA